MSAWVRQSTTVARNLETAAMILEIHSALSVTSMKLIPTGTVPGCESDAAGLKVPSHIVKMF